MKMIYCCCRPPPKNEDEMMVEIFAYIDRIFGIVRPRKVLYMAIDGTVSSPKMFHFCSLLFTLNDCRDLMCSILYLILVLK